MNKKNIEDALNRIMDNIGEIWRKVDGGNWDIIEELSNKPIVYLCESTYTEAKAIMYALETYKGE